MSSLSNELIGSIIELLITLPIILFALTVHEVSHGLVANALGDPTAKNLGRLTLNPIKHLDPIGFLCMIFLRFGWAKPVPINTRNFKNPRRDMALTGLAGPMSNFLLGIVFTLLLKVFVSIYYNIEITASNEALIKMIYTFLYYSVFLNIALSIFNLLPFPPFDGSRIFYVFLPAKWYFGIMKYERYIGLGILGLFILLGRVFDVYPTSYITGKIMNLLFKLFGIYI